MPDCKVNLWGGLGGFSVLVIVSAIIAQQFGFFSKVNVIDARLEGGVPSVHVARNIPMERPNELKLIKEAFIMKEEVDLFGVVLGPSGTGKTYLTRLVCNLYPSGVLYYEIVLPSYLPEGLAKTVGMRLRDDANLLDVLFEKLGISTFVNFYSLPEDISKALTYVIETVAERAAIYKQRHGRVACIFIDGVDLLAKEYPKVFIQLVYHAKYFANKGTLLLVLVSSEGHIVPLMDTTSSITRKAPVVEILDMDYNSSKDYLIQRDIPDSLAKRIFNLTGGRFVYLIKAIEEYKRGKDVFHLIEKSLLTPFFFAKVSKTHAYLNATTVMNLVLSKGTIDPNELILSLDEAEREAIIDTIEGLVKLNLLRFTAEGLITWHSQLVYNGMIQYYKTDDGLEQ